MSCLINLSMTIQIIPPENLILSLAMSTIAVKKNVLKMKYCNFNIL